MNGEKFSEGRLVTFPSFVACTRKVWGINSTLVFLRVLKGYSDVLRT